MSPLNTQTSKQAKIAAKNYIVNERTENCGHLGALLMSRVNVYCVVFYAFLSVFLCVISVDERLARERLAALRAGQHDKGDRRQRRSSRSRSRSPYASSRYECMHFFKSALMPINSLQVNV